MKIKELNKILKAYEKAYGPNIEVKFYNSKTNVYEEPKSIAPRNAKPVYGGNNGDVELIKNNTRDNHPKNMMIIAIKH